jgi:hypothetical protein
MTDDRLEFIEHFCIPRRGSDKRSLIIELVRECKRARRSEKICRSASMIYKQDKQDKR